VRSNQDNRAGFVNDINRACVALSRARQGLYVIGNFDVITSKSKIWKDVVKDVQSNECVGQALPLVCQNHGTKVYVRKMSWKLVETSMDFVGVSKETVVKTGKRKRQNSNFKQTVCQITIFLYVRKIFANVTIKSLSIFKNHL